jgi:7-carboxy-7-deazaguanine synthase
MESVRLSELYTSVQCEGPNTGKLTQFVRFAGCNMRCPGWPCDTQHAIQPSIFLHQSEKLGVADLTWRIEEEGAATGAKNICLTGGEPFLQDNDLLKELVDNLLRRGYTVECFSNGSFIYPDWALGRVTFVMDWKLEGSGEASTKYSERLDNARMMFATDNIKFVVMDDRDLHSARAVWQALINIDGVRAQFWVGPAWDRIEIPVIIDFVKKHKLPWRLNVQVHKYIWPADERGV